MAARKTAKKKIARPHGRDETKVALLEAANELFGQRGPDAVSVRDVAAHAKVNHALVHRHFGTKERLLHEVLLDHAAAFRAAQEDGRDADVEALALRMFRIARERPAFTKILAQLLLTGHAPSEFTLAEGGIAKLAGVIAEAHPDATAKESQLATASAVAMLFGWAFFSPFVLYATGYEGTEAEATRHAEEALAALLRRRP